MGITPLCRQNLIFLCKQSGLKISPNLARALKDPNHILGKFFSEHDFLSDKEIKEYACSSLLTNHLNLALRCFLGIETETANTDGAYPEIKPLLEEKRQIFLKEEERTGRSELDYILLTEEKPLVLSSTKDVQAVTSGNAQENLARAGFFASDYAPCLLARAWARAGEPEKALEFIRQAQQDYHELREQKKKTTTDILANNKISYAVRYTAYFNNLQFQKILKETPSEASKAIIRGIKKRMEEEIRHEPSFINCMNKVQSIKIFFELRLKESQRDCLLPDISGVKRSIDDLQDARQRSAAQIFLAEKMTEIGLFKAAVSYLEEKALPAVDEVPEIFVRGMRLQEIVEALKRNPELISAESMLVGIIARMGEVCQGENGNWAEGLLLLQRLALEGDLGRVAEAMTEITEQLAGEELKGILFKKEFFLALSEIALLIGEFGQAETLIKQALSSVPR